MLTKQKVINRFREGLEKLADQGRQELAAQGHKATGKGIASLEGVVTSDNLQKLVGVIMANDYLIPVDTGVPASRVPYGRGGGGTSKYIQGLLDWVGIIKPGLKEKQKISFVFSIAAAHKKEGIPTRASARFAQNGRRKNWIKHGLEDKAEQFEDEFRLFDLIVDSFDEAIAFAQRA